MTQREFERLVEEAKIKAQERLQEGFSEWLGKRVFRGEEVINGEEESEANQAQDIQLQS